MKRLKPYLIFSGHCREALEFYKECFDGEIVMVQTFADSPVDVPREHGQRIFNSEFRAGEIDFMASDDMPGREVTPGRNFALFVSFPEPEEQKRVFGELSQGGEVLFPIEKGFGMLVDRFGIQWMLESHA